MSKATKRLRILEIDPWLEPFKDDLNHRLEYYDNLKKQLVGEDGSLVDFANGYAYFGFFRTSTGWVYREWAPGADEMHLIGDFNDWDRYASPMHRLENGVWEIKLRGINVLRHGQKIKVQVSRRGRKFDRVPLYIHWTEQDKLSGSLVGKILAPEKKFRWTDVNFRKTKCEELLIYEAHIGMAQEKEAIGSYREFADKIIPRIVKDGYTAIQLMAIQEHPYYASFGYQVSNFFAVSSWYGEPDDLKYLINQAHKHELRVLLDVVHSHAVSNTADGINLFDGTFTQFFHAGERGNHPAWGTKLFDYGKHDVLHFLLSNLKYWQEEYHFDGFRFDGVTSMLYTHHGLGTNFDNYKKYFDISTDIDAVAYLQLANDLIHEVNPNAITVAEDMSGMPGMCLKIKDGGIGFDYRLAMGVPDYWIKTLTNESDDNRNLERMWHELSGRRPEEKNIGYAESHDQALVGDKTLIFRMADAEMYHGMEKKFHSPTIDRAIALHKMIRLISLALSGDAYLNFMGNEFGHPEWIDFPREGNHWSFKYARRQWSLVDNDLLKYDFLQKFDQAMLSLSKLQHLFKTTDIEKLAIDQTTKCLVFRRGNTIFAFNFHPNKSQEKLHIPTNYFGNGDFQVILSSDDVEFGGQDRIDKKYVYKTKKVNGFEFYLPCRSAAVFKKLN